MKNYRVWGWLFLFFWGMNGLAQSDQLILQKVDQLVNDRQYYSAFELLYLADSLHQNPELVLKKVDLTLNYFTVSLLHQGFGFVNLSGEDQLEDFRGKSENDDVFNFKINESLNSLIINYPNDFRLHKALGNFYYDCHLKYNNSWVKKNKELFSLIETNYQAANAHGQGDFLSYYVLGYIQTFNEKYAKALPLFQKSLELSPGFPTTYYDLAHVYYFLDQKDKAIQNAEKAIELFADSVRQADAARLIANIYNELKISDKAIRYYQISDSINPNNYLTLKNLLGQYLRIKSDQADIIREKFFAFGPLNPTIYLDLSTIYVTENQTQDLIDFFEGKVNEYRKDVRIRANLYYYSGNLYLEFDEEKAARNLTKARKLFTKFLSPKNRIFNSIDRTLQKL